MNLRLTAPAVLALLLALPASAQNMKPGLWELNSKMQSGNGQLEQAMAEMQKQMASMPPEQRKMMEGMMAKQGVSMGGGGMLAKVCVTKEMVAQSKVPMQTRGNCTHTHSPVVGNSMKMSFSCTDPVSNGEGQVTFSGDNSYTMNMKMMSTVKGKPESVTIDATGRWLGSDCGDVKPVAMPPAK
ncbi:MAG: DUF3617 domain-containing protein [Pseudomonadota bacterium]